jgi:hypothetical protein
MNKNKPTLHVSICFKGDPSIAKNLQKSVSEYSARIADDPYNPDVEFCFDSQEMQEEKLTLIGLSYNKVLTRRLKRSIKNDAFFYSIIAVLSALTIQRIYNRDPDIGTASWLLISIISTEKEEDSYNVQWSMGLDCRLENQRWADIVGQ